MTEQDKRETPSGSPVQHHSSDRGRSTPPLRKEIQARIVRPHKGDVGRAGTNEEIFQGSKEKELRGTQ